MAAAGEALRILKPPAQPNSPAARTRMADIVGWYEFAYDGGSFKVCFRPGGKFFCAEYQVLPAVCPAKLCATVAASAARGAGYVVA